MGFLQGLLLGGVPLDKGSMASEGVWVLGTSRLGFPACGL